MNLTVSEIPASTRPRERALGAWGVLLCGGASRRMGRDKALLELGGKPLIQRAAAELGAVTERVLLASGASPRYAELGHECVLDRAPDVGPLGGLEAALARLAAEGVRHAVVLACDMPRVRASQLGVLLRRARASGAEVTLVATEAGDEPLLAVYDVRVLAAVQRALARGARRMNAFHGEVRVLRVPERELAPGCATNLNTPDELAAFAEERP